MKVYLRFKHLHYALMATELLFDLDTELLEDLLETKRTLGAIFGQIIDPTQVTYEQREQLSTLRVKEGDLQN